VSEFCLLSSFWGCFCGNLLCGHLAFFLSCRYLSANPLCYNINYQTWAGTNDYTSVTFCAAANCPELYGPSCSSPCLCGNASCFSGASGNGTCIFRMYSIFLNELRLFLFSHSSSPFFCNLAASCFAGNDAVSSWPTRLVGSSAVFNCSAGYFGSNKTSICQWNGISSHWDKNPCHAVYCSAGETDSVSWPSTLAGTFFTFSCKDGYYSASPCSTVLCVQYGGGTDWATLPSCQGYCFYHNFIVG